MKRASLILTLCILSNLFALSPSGEHREKHSYSNEPASYIIPQKPYVSDIEHHFIESYLPEKHQLTLRNHTKWHIHPSFTTDIELWSPKMPLIITQNTDSENRLDYPYLIFSLSSNIAIPIQPSSEIESTTSCIRIRSIDFDNFYLKNSDDFLWQIVRKDLHVLDEWMIGDHIIYATDKHNNDSGEYHSSILINITHPNHPCLRVFFHGFPIYVD